MALSPQKFREMVFQMLYSCDFTTSDSADVIAMLMHELEVTKRAASDAYARAQDILAKSGEIDGRIRTASTEYQFERISNVEKNLIRLALYEMFYDETIPQKVAIAEAIRLCRKFGTPESSLFVNAILDAIYKQPQQQPAIAP